MQKAETNGEVDVGQTTCFDHLVSCAVPTALFWPVRAQSGLFFVHFFSGYLVNVAVNRVQILV